MPAADRLNAAAAAAEVESVAADRLPAAADPILSASLFAAGGLDDLIDSLVAPFWRAARAAGLGAESCLWFIRYSHHGEHLKLRIHAPADRRGLLRRRLAAAAERYFTAPGPAPLATPEPAGGRPRAVAMPVDSEDRLTPPPASGRPDRALLWTHHERSLVVFGSPLLVSDDDAVRHMTTCFGRGCEALLRAGAASAERTVVWRRGFLAAMVRAALDALFATPREQRRYLAYHRDWLLRSPVLAAGGGAELVGQRLARFEAGLAVRGLAAVRSELAAGRDAAAAAAAAGAVPEWRAAVAALAGYLAGSSRLAARDLDPFARGAVPAALFKVLHALANAVGLNSLQEARAHHYLLRTSGGARPRRGPLLLPARCASRPEAEAGIAGGEAAPRLFDFEAEYRWDLMVAASGERGRRWADDYKRQCGDIWQTLKTAIRQLRQRRLVDAWKLLAQADRRRAELPAAESQSQVLGRFYFGIVAYAHFCQQRFDEAGGALSEALNAIRQALDAEEILLPFAAMATDMLIKRVHVERARCNWRAMNREVRALNEVAADRRPLVVLASGRPIYHATIGAWVAEVAPPIAERERIVRYLADVDLRVGQLGREVATLYALPGFVIPYP